MAGFVCTQCGLCCSNLGADRMVVLLREDISRMAKSLAMEVQAFTERYCERSDLLTEAAGVDVYRLKYEDSKCIFLDENNLCSIHAVKPFQCRHGPERFLTRSMTRDYDCMKDVDLVDGEDLTEYLLLRLIDGG